MTATPFRLDELARRAGVATTTVRLYQNKGLLPGPELVGRTGWYGPEHLARLHLIARLQEQGFSLAGIGKLLATWEEGGGITDLVGPGGDAHVVVLDAAGLAQHLPAEAVTPADIQRAIDLGLVEPTADGGFRIPDRRFLETGATLVRLGVPVDVVLDEWAHLRAVTDGIAQRFIALFEQHLLPERSERPDVDALSSTLAQLRQAAGQVVAAALDASIAAAATERLEGITPEPAPSSPSPRRRPPSAARRTGR